MTKIAWLLTFIQVLIARIFGLFLPRFRNDSVRTDLSLTRSILVMRTDEIGDFVLTTPFLSELRRLAPDAKITVVVKPEVAPIAQICDSIDHVIIYDHRSDSVSPYRWSLVMPARAASLAIKHLRPMRFDIAFLPRFASDSCYATFAAYLSGAAKRVGFSEKITLDKAIFNHGFDMLLTDICRERSVKNASLIPLDLLKLIGLEPRALKPKLTPTPELLDEADKLLESIGCKDHPVLIAFGVSPGHSQLKQWPLDNFVALGKRLVEELGAKILVLGAPDEVETAQKVCDQIGQSAVNLAGKTSLQLMAAVFSRCRLYVGNDIGPSHIAAAVNIKTIALFGASCAHTYSPQGDVIVISRVLDCGVCKNGHKQDRCGYCIYELPKCMADISVDEVFDTSAKFIGG